MTFVGASGHQDLPPQGRQYIEVEVRRLLQAVAAPLTGVCCLAAGADQLFAQLILEVGGQLRVVVPCREYESTFSSAAEKDTYSQLLQRATSVSCLPYDLPNEEAFMAAGREIVRASDTVIAIWDGMPARGLGGTADVVGYARELSVAINVVWPSGLRRP